MRKTIQVFGLLLPFLGLLVLGGLLPLAEEMASAARWATELGTAGWLAFSLIYAVGTVLLFPGFVLNVAAGAVFGFVPALAATWLGATLGAVLAFLVSRHGARRFVERWISARPSFAAIDRAVAREGWKIVVLTRNSPLFPFNMQNYAYGLTQIPFWHYTLATLTGIVPGLVLYVYAGTLGRNGLMAVAPDPAVDPLRLPGQALGFLATVAAAVTITRLCRRALREAGVESGTY